MLRIKGSLKVKNVMACFNCGQSNHGRLDCRGQSMESVLQEFGYYSQLKR